MINSTPSETRVALVENGMLQEVWLERASHTGYIGNIYNGQVSRVLPGLQAAFVDIGCFWGTGRLSIKNRMAIRPTAKITIGRIILIAFCLAVIGFSFFRPQPIRPWIYFLIKHVSFLF